MASSASRCLAVSDALLRIWGVACTGGRALADGLGGLPSPADARLMVESRGPCSDSQRRMLPASAASREPNGHPVGPSRDVLSLLLWPVHIR